MPEKEASKKTEEAPFPRIHMLWKKNSGNESKGNSESKIYIARVNGSKLGFETISLIILKYTALNFFDFEIFLEIE